MRRIRREPLASAELKSGAPQRWSRKRCRAGSLGDGARLEQAEGILGKEVRSTADENMGRIVDVIVDRTGRVRAAVIDFGGFLGVGNRKIAVDWNALNFAADSDKRDVVTLELTRDQVKTAPEYKDRRAVIVLGAAGLDAADAVSVNPPRSKEPA